MSGSGARDGRPAAVSRRVVCLLTAAWSLLAGGWFVSSGGDLSPSPTALAAGLFIAVVWGLGMLMLVLFLRRPDDERSRPGPPHGRWGR